MKRIPRPGALLLAASLACAGFAANLAAAQLDAGKSSVTAVARQIGVPMEGKFKRFAAAVDFDPARLASSSAKVEIEVARCCERKGIPFQILRTSIICGRVMDAPLYYTPKFDVFYGWLKFFWQLKRAELHSPLRLCVHEAATMNVVPVDFVAKAIVKALRSHVGQLNIVNPEIANTVAITRTALEHIGY